MLARRVTFRVAVGAAQRSARLAYPGSFAIVAQSPRAIVPVAAHVSSSRHYATPSKPKKGSVGESSIRTRPRKSALDKAQEVAAKAEAKAAKAEARGVKRVAAAQARESKAQTTKPSAKPKKKTAGSKVKPKPKPKPKTSRKPRVAKPKKELTEVQQARRTERAGQADIKVLKAVALKAPTLRASTAWTMYLAERARATLKGYKGASADVRNILGQTASEAAAAYRQLDASEREVSCANTRKRTPGSKLGVRMKKPPSRDRVGGFFYRR